MGCDQLRSYQIGGTRLRVKGGFGLKNRQTLTATKEAT
jgi:hypothetical protein